MSILVFRLTGEASKVGFTIAFQFAPMLFLGAYAGAMADRLNKRKMAIITQSAMASQALLLGVLDLTGAINLPLVYAMSLFLGIANAFDNPARRSLVTELVEPAEIPNATSLNTAVMTSSRIFGPAVGAVLVGVIGTGWCFILNGVTFSAIIFLAHLAAPRRDVHVGAHGRRAANQCAKRCGSSRAAATCSCCSSCC